MIREQTGHLFLSIARLVPQSAWPREAFLVPLRFPFGSLFQTSRLEPHYAESQRAFARDGTTFPLQVFGGLTWARLIVRIWLTQRHLFRDGTLRLYYAAALLLNASVDVFSELTILNP